MSTTRLKSLDGIRGIAVLLVVVGHVAPRYAHQGGIVGVTLFFVLSGYLISSVLLAESSRTGKIDWSAFYIRRALRLVPALVVLLAVLPVIMWAAGDSRLDEYPLDALLALFYLGDFAQASGSSMGLLDHTWSLAVEEQFYLVWPLVIALVVLRRPRKPVVPVIASLAGVAVLWRLVASVIWGFDRVYFAPDTNAFALLLGCTLAAWVYDGGNHQGGTVSPVWMVCALAALGAMAIVPESGANDELVKFGALAIGAVGLLLVAAGRTTNYALLTNPVLRWFGKISYALYLWHVPLVYLQFDGQGMGNAGRAAMAVLAIGIAWLSWVLVESHALRLKARFERGPLIGDNETIR